MKFPHAPQPQYLWIMFKENRRLIPIKRYFRKGFLEIFFMGNCPVINADDLKSINFDHLVDERVNIYRSDHFNELRAVTKFFMVAGDEINTERSIEFFKRKHAPEKIGCLRTVKQISADKNNVMWNRICPINDPLRKCVIIDLSQVDITDPDRFPSPPFFRQIG